MHVQCLFLIWRLTATQSCHPSTYKSHFYVLAHYSSFMTSEKLKTHAQRDHLPYLCSLNGLSPASGLFEHSHLLFLIWMWSKTERFVFTADSPRIRANSLAKNRTERREPAVEWFLHPFGLRVVKASWQCEAHLPKPIPSDLMRGHTHFQQLFFSCHLGIWFLDQSLGTETMRSCQLKWHRFKGSPTE